MSFLYSYPDYSGVSLKISTNNLVPILCSGLKPENNQPINMPYSNTTQNSAKTTYNNCAHSWSSVADQNYLYPTGSCFSFTDSGPGLAYQCGPAFWNPRTTLRGHGGLPPSNNNQKRETWINSRIGISTGVSKKAKVTISTITWGVDSKINPWAREIFLTDTNISKSIFAVSWQRLEPTSYSYHSHIQLNEVEKGTAEVWDTETRKFIQRDIDLTERLVERFPNDPNMRDIVVVTNHSSHQYSISGLSAGLYCVQIISRVPYPLGPTAKDGVDLNLDPPLGHRWEYVSYSFANGLEGVPHAVWATAPTFFAIIEPAPTRIETINTNGSMAPYDEENSSYKGTINVKVATNRAFSPDVGDLNTYPSLGPLVVGLFPIVEDSLGKITPSKSISTSTKESVNNDNLNYIITGVKPGKYYIGAQNTAGDISYFQSESDPVHIKDGKIEFEMQDIFAPRSYNPNNRSVAPEAWNVDNQNFYGTCFCSVESIASPKLLFTPVLDITTKTIDNTRQPISYPSVPIVPITNYKIITSTSDPDKQVSYYKVFGLFPGAYEITISSNPDSRLPALETTLKRTMIMPSANPIKVQIVTKEDTSGSTVITKRDHSNSCLILSNMPNGSFEVSIDGPKQYEIFEEFIPYSLDQDDDVNYSYFRTGISSYEYKKKIVENKYTIKYRLGLQPVLPKLDTEARLDDIFIDGKLVENVNKISNLPSCYLEVIIKDIFYNSPSMISAEFKNINLTDVTMREYGQQISIFPEVSLYEVLNNVISSSNGILVDIPEKIFSIYEPVNLMGCSTRNGSIVVSHNMTEGEKTRVKTKMVVLGDCINPNTIITTISNESLMLSKGANDTCENTTLTIISRDRLHGDILADITNQTNKIKFVSGNIGLLKKGDILIAKGLATNTRIVGIDTFNKTIDISKDAVATILKAKIIIILAPPPELISPDTPNTPPVNSIISRNPPSVRVPVDHGFAGWPSDPDNYIPPAPKPPSSAPKQTGTLSIVVTPARSTYTITEKTEGSKTYFNSASLELSPGVYTIQGDENYLKINRLLNDTHTISITRDSKESINLVFNKCLTVDIPYTIP